ncbi:MAG: hypothetical protein LBQ59_05100 [Candidatus Peribacteria bacterium]|jgi:hypothetical protein|nr:hypothetical protein [Candidatus Peribacteria bacterium]
MKKTFSLILVFLLLGITTTFGDFQIDTSLSVVKQQAFKNEIDKIYITFENNLSKLSKDKQINSLKITITNLDTILKKRQSDTNKFVLYYLRYLLNEKLDYLNSDSIDLN